MQTVIEYGISAGQWIAGHTVIPYPVQSTAALAVLVVAIFCHAAWALHHKSRIDR